MNGRTDVCVCLRRGGQRLRLFASTIAFFVLAGCVGLETRSGDSALLRAQSLALLQTINADLLSNPSATLTLESWCADHRLAEPANVVVRRFRGAIKPLPVALRRKLEVAADTPLGYRHVQLVCGDEVLSEADNWYVPGRLTAAMNRQLNTSDIPFGKVVWPLHFQRRTLSAKLLWSPMPPGWEMSGWQHAGAGVLHIPHFVLRHEAILYTEKQVPFSAVVETYTNGLFDFGPWAKYRD